MPVLRIPVDITTNGPVCNNSYHLFTNGGDETTGANQAITALQAMYAAVAGAYHTSVTWRIGDNVRSVDESPAQQVPTTPLTGAGTASGNQDPRQAAAIVTWLTGLVGKSRRGRTYFGPLISGVVDVDGLGPTSTWQTNFQNAADGLLAASVPQGIWVVWSPTLSVNTAISSALARPYLGTVRGRLT